MADRSILPSEAESTQILDLERDRRVADRAPFRRPAHAGWCGPWFLVSAAILRTTSPSLNWSVFLDDFQRHWPTDEDIYVDFVRDGACGNALARSGNRRQRRLTEVRAGTAKSVFHFDVQGSVAKSTHAGLPWLRHLRLASGRRVHFWPFDGWTIPAGRSVVAEVYPSLWSKSFGREGRDPDQHDAYSIAAWMRRADGDGSLQSFFHPHLDEDERKKAEIEGWILGVM
jgi:hypothetical protein